MTPEDRDYWRAEATMRILAAMYTNHIPRPVPRDETKAQAKSRERKESVRRMERALEAANQADAMLAELALREEFKPPEPDLPAEVIAMHGGRIPEGAHVLHCKHGKASFEPCEKCDAEDAAEKGAAAKGGENGENGKVETGGGAVV